MNNKSSSNSLALKPVFLLVLPLFTVPLFGYGLTGKVSDDFNRDNTAAATASTDPNPIGGHYVIESGSWQIVGNSYLEAGSTGVMYDNRLETRRSSEYEFSISIDVLHPNYTTAQSSRQAGVLLNYQDPDNHYIIRWGNQSNGNLGTIQVVKRENGSNSQLGSLVTGIAIPSGWYSWTFNSSAEQPDTIAYTISAQGSDTPLYSGSFTDATFTDGYFGFYRTGSGVVGFDDYTLRVLDPSVFSNEVAVSYDLYGRNYRFYEEQPHLPPNPEMQLEGEIILLPDYDGEAVIMVNALFTERGGQETEITVFHDTLQLVSGVPFSLPVNVELPPQPGRVVFSTQSSDPGIIFSGNVTEIPIYASPIVPAFPGATGFGAFTPGGRGGEVYKVTTLEDYASNETPIVGSLRYALEQPGPRIVIFAVSGDIRLKRALNITNPYLTIAGNTAPFPGVSITGYQTSLRADHAVLRYLRFRLSPEVLRERFAGGNYSEWDSFQAVDGEYVLLDHLSGSHSVDETLSMTYMDRASMQHCLAAYSLNSVFHPKWPEVHNFGSLTAYIGRPDRHAAVSSIYNAWINHDRRMPGLSAVEDPDNLASWIDLRHSLMYNWGSNAAGSEAPAREEWRQNYHLNFVGNYLKPGPETPLENRYAGLTVRGALNKLYLEGNIHDQDKENNQPTNQEGLVRYIYADVSSDHFLSEAVPSPYAAAPEIPGLNGILTDFVGASLPARDSVDAAAVLDVLNDTGYHPFVDMHVDTSPPLPDLVSIRHVYHNEEDVFPLWWKRLQGLADDAVIDPHADENGDGYTNIEKYMYGLNLNDSVVSWALPVNNINPLDRLTGDETDGLGIPSVPGIGWADREVDETVFSGADGLVVMSSSTNDSTGFFGVRNVLDPGSTAWSSGGLGGHGMTGAVSDDFNRANTAIATSSTDPNPISHYYVIDSGSWSIGGESYLQGDSGGYMYDSRLETLRSDEFAFDLSVSALHPNYDSGIQGSRMVGIALNYIDIGNHYLIRWGYDEALSGEGGVIQLVKVENGSTSQIDRITGLNMPGDLFYEWNFKSTTDDPETISFSVSDSSTGISIFSGSLTDNDFTTGHMAFNRSGGGTVRFDDYSMAVVHEPRGHPGPIGARVEEGVALVFAFSMPRKLNGILIHRTDLNAYPSAHDPSGALLQGLKGWPDHWVDLAEAGSWPVFSSEHRMHQLEIPQALQGPYAAYRLVFPSAHGAEDLRIQHVTFDASDLSDIQVILSDESKGVVSGAGLYAKNAWVTLTPEPVEFFIFSHWSGDVPLGGESESPLTFSADANRVLTAHFSEIVTEATLTPHWWLAQHGLTEPSFEAAAGMDHNGNGHTASEEFIVGIDPGPSGAQDFFQLNLNFLSAENLLFRWPSREGRRYVLQSASHLSHGYFSDVVGAEDLPATPPVNEWMMDIDPEEKVRFFRLRVRYPH